MSDSVYRDVAVNLNRIYTKRGDGGKTDLVGGVVVEKDDLRLEVYGTVDELNAAVGLARVSAEEVSQVCSGLTFLPPVLLRIQHELFNLGSVLATEPGSIGVQQPKIVDADTDQLEKEIDQVNDELSALPSFVLPGGCRLNAELHLCRTICRRAERHLVALNRDGDIPNESLRYLNRLSDAFFVWSRWVNVKLDASDVLWQPNETTSGSKNKHQT